MGFCAQPVDVLYDGRRLGLDTAPVGRDDSIEAAVAFVVDDPLVVASVDTLDLDLKLGLAGSKTGLPPKLDDCIADMLRVWKASFLDLGQWNELIHKAVEAEVATGVVGLETHASISVEVGTGLSSSATHSPDPTDVIPRTPVEEDNIEAVPDAVGGRGYARETSAEDRDQRPVQDCLRFGGRGCKRPVC